jgi:hypothetical protein
MEKLLRKYFLDVLYIAGGIFFSQKKTNLLCTKHPKNTFAAVFPYFFPSTFVILNRYTKNLLQKYFFGCFVHLTLLL